MSLYVYWYINIHTDLRMPRYMNIRVYMSVNIYIYDYIYIMCFFLIIFFLFVDFDNPPRKPFV